MGRVVVDIGCGERKYPGAIGLDFVALPAVDVLGDANFGLPFRDSSVDIATSFDVIYCLDDESERLAVQEMWRVLKPGGVALFNVAALEVLHGSHSTLTMEVRRYSKRRLTSVLTSAGFKIERMTFTNMVTFPITLAVRWFDRVTGRAAKPSDADLQVPAAPINRTFDAALAAEHSLMSFVDLPIGTSLMCVARKPRTTAG